MNVYHRSHSRTCDNIFQIPIKQKRKREKIQMTQYFLGVTVLNSLHIVSIG